MVLFIVLGIVVLITFFVMGFLFLMLDKEGQKTDEKAVPLTDLSQLKRDFSSSLLEPQIPKTVDEPNVVPAFTPQVSLPTQASKYVAGEDIYKKRARELEEELLNISKKAEGQSNEARQMIETLSQENESLKIQQANLTQVQQKLTELETQTDHLHTENSALQTQLDSSNTKVQALEVEMAAVKIQMGEEIAQARATVSQLNIEKESWEQAAKKGSQVDAVSQELEASKVQQAQLKQNFEDLEKTNQQLRELNGDLIKKVETLQYELVKARAQSTGLERIGFNYKNQLEDFFKKINEVQLTNEKLSEELKVRAS